MKVTAKSEMRAWGLPEKMDKGSLRYTSPLEKGIYWYYFSIEVRKRDFEKYGTCISCGKSIRSWRDAHCGHFIAASRCGMELLFDPLNNNMECAGCNLLDESHTVAYRINLVKRHGEKAVKELEDRWMRYKNGEVQSQWPKEMYMVKLAEMGIRKETI